MIQIKEKKQYEKTIIKTTRLKVQIILANNFKPFNKYIVKA
jgi:hypothetical protein